LDVIIDLRCGEEIKDCLWSKHLRLNESGFVDAGSAHVCFKQLDVVDGDNSRHRTSSDEMRLAR